MRTTTTRVLRAARSCMAAAFLTAITAAIPNVVRAQVGDPPPVLPDLAPREVEIRGELQIRFPLLERQPLVGFNPPPQIPVLPAGRRPIVEEYKQRRADLPQASIERPDAPTALRNPTGRMSGELEAAAGSYFDRLVRARFGGELSPSTTFRTSLDYSGSDGARTIPNSGVHNPFDSMEGGLALDYATNRLQASGSIDAFADYYPLYADGAALPAPVVGFPDGPNRSSRGASLAGHVGSGLGAETEYKVHAGWSIAEIATELTGRTEANERRLDVGGNVVVPVGSVRMLVDASGGTSGINTSGFVGATRQHVSGSVGVGVGGALGFSGNLGIRVLGTRYDSRTSVSGSQREILYLSPDIGAELRLTRAISAFANNRPGIEENALGDVFRSSPFVESAPDGGPTLNVVDAKAGLRITHGRLAFTPYAGYRWSPNRLYYSSGVASPTPTASTVTRDAKSETMLAGASLAVGLTGSLTAAVTGEYHDARLIDLDVPVPYYPSIQTAGTLSYRFLSDRALIRLQGRYQSSRTVDEAETTELDAITSLDVFASFDITQNIGLTLRGINLTDSNLETWNQYRRTGRQIVGGLRFRW